MNSPNPEEGVALTLIVRMVFPDQTNGLRTREAPTDEGPRQTSEKTTTNKSETEPVRPEAACVRPRHLQLVARERRRTMTAPGFLPLEPVLTKETA